MLAQRTGTGRWRRAKRGWPILASLLPWSVAMLAGAVGNLEKTFETGRYPRISVTNLTGRVVVRGWDKEQVHAVYSTVSPRVEVDTEVLPRAGTADKIHFTTHVLDPLVPASEQTADYTLEVPVGASLEIGNPQGKVEIDNLQADATVESVGGDISVTDYSGHLTARSMGGNIEIIRPSGHVEADTITGNLHFISPTTTHLHATTTSGRILYEGDFIGGGDYRLSDYSGDVDIICPAAASFELSAKTVHGKVQNALPIVPRRRPASPMSSANSLLGTRNAGEATVEVRSFKGTIRIRPQ